MTPDKCEHANILYRYLEHGRDAAFLECAACGQRFVPSDVLEEARQVLSDVMQWAVEDYWDTVSTHDSVKDVLRRIDEVLGKKT